MVSRSTNGLEQRTYRPAGWERAPQACRNWSWFSTLSWRHNPLSGQAGLSAERLRAKRRIVSRLNTGFRCATRRCAPMTVSYQPLRAQLLGYVLTRLWCAVLVVWELSASGSGFWLERINKKFCGL